MSRLVWTGVNKTAAHYRRLRSNDATLIFPRAYQSFAALPLPERRPRERGVTLPHIPSLTRPHPVPDIEDRIRFVKRQSTEEKTYEG